MPSYELTCIFHPSLSTDEVSALVDRVESEINSHGAVLSKDVWGRMRLAYPIQKVMEGTYVHYTIDVSGQTIALIERWLHLQESVIRHLIVKGIVVYEKAPQSIAQGMRERVTYAPRTEEAVSEEAVSEEVVSEEVVSEEAVSEEVVSEEAVSEDAVSEEVVSEEAVSEEAVSEEAVSEEVVSEEAVSEEAVSEEAVSEEAVSEEENN